MVKINLQNKNTVSHTYGGTKMGLIAPLWVKKVPHIISLGSVATLNVQRDL